MFMTRRTAMASGLLCLAATTLTTKASPMTDTTDAPAGVHDFDFLMGRWKVWNRRLRERWVGSTDWYEFPGTCDTRLMLGGVANVDELVLPTLGFSGMTVRTLDVEKGLWSIYWINSKIGVVTEPVVGKFVNGIGTFIAPDKDGKRDILCRFVWTIGDQDRPHWEQAFSDDGGATWETNWVNDFERI
ncbi:hypothetical protein sos41_34150 [Alphaproteobacteria bacterium SO-S41]|nr:hypothetical protein sos41_34150 [Alphaproteobacteria bacterium SO-S41]